MRCIPQTADLALGATHCLKNKISPKMVPSNLTICELLSVIPLTAIDSRSISLSRFDVPKMISSVLVLFICADSTAFYFIYSFFYGMFYKCILLGQGLCESMVICISQTCGISALFYFDCS